MTELLHPADAGKEASLVRWTGVATLPPRELDRVDADDRWDEIIQGWRWERTGDDRILLLPKPNLVTTSGVQRSLRRLFAISGPPAAVDSMGVDNGTTAPVAGTGNSGGTSTARTIRAFDATPTEPTTTQVQALGTYTNATVAFVMKRLFLSAGTADAAGSLQAMTGVFTIDFTGFSSWSQTFAALYNGAGA